MEITPELLKLLLAQLNQKQLEQVENLIQKLIIEKTKD